ncbi:MAG: DmsC/YnfH family molybdoenzyme membrane anchor subunit [Telluria sp.]
MSRHSHAADDDFKVGTRQQTAWGTHMATAFFFGEAGAGLFLVAQFFDFALGMALGLLMVVVGKGGGHLVHLGKPSRGWRAFTKIGSSWVSRGLAAIVVLAVFGALHLWQSLHGVLPAPLAWLVAGIAGAAAMVIMVYQGFAMSHSSAISLWSSGLMPITSLVFALLNGVLLTIVLGYNEAFLAGHADTLRMLQAAVVVLILFGLVTILSMLNAARYGSEGGRESVRLLLSTDFAATFVPLVIGVGMAGAAVLTAFAPKGLPTMIAVLAAELTGYYAFRILVFKAGTYDPVMKFGRSFTH